MCFGAWSLVWCSVVLCYGRLTYPLTMRQGRFQKRPEVQCGGVGWGRSRGPRSRQVHVRSIKPCSPSATRVATNQPNGAEWRAATQRQTIDRPQGRPFIVCHDKQQAASSKQRRAKPKSTSTSTSTSESRSRSRSKRVGQESITEGRGAGGHMDQQVRASGSRRHDRHHQHGQVW